MITYRQVAEFMLRIIQDEGKTDAQSHIGTCVYRGDYKDFNEFLFFYFGGKVKTFGNTDFKEGQKFFYVYYDKDSMDYCDAVLSMFSLSECAIITDDYGTKVAVFAIEPEICITYKD